MVATFADISERRRSADQITRQITQITDYASCAGRTESLSWKKPIGSLEDAGTARQPDRTRQPAGV